MIYRYMKQKLSISFYRPICWRGKCSKTFCSCSCFHGYGQETAFNKIQYQALFVRIKFSK